MTSDSSSAAPSVESLRQQIEDELRLHGRCPDDEPAEACVPDLRRAHKLLRQFLDHERSLVAEIQRLKEELEAAKGDAIHGWSEESHQREHKEDYARMLEAAEAEIQRLTDALKTNTEKE